MKPVVVTVRDRQGLRALGIKGAAVLRLVLGSGAGLASPVLRSAGQKRVPSPTHTQGPRLLSLLLETLPAGER